MYKVALLGKDITSEEELHLILKKELELPDYYGENLNALWDCLSSWVKLPLEIEWIDFEKSKEQIGCYADELLHLFKEAQEELDGFVITVK